MAAAEGAPEDSGGGVPGVWGAWGPWSACSRSCSGGVMEQTRPCLPGSYALGGLRPGAPARTFAGHVVSAVRTSVPLHRSQEEPRPAAGLNASRQGPVLRGSRHPQARVREPAAERRYTPSPGPARATVLARPLPCPMRRTLLCTTDCLVNALLLPGGEEFLAPYSSFHLLIYFAAF